MNLSEKLMSVQNSIGIHLTETELKKTIESIDNIKKHRNPPEEIFKQSCYIFLFFAALLEAVIFLVKGISSHFINNYTISLMTALSIILIYLISITRVLLIQFQNLKNYLFEAVLQICDIYVYLMTSFYKNNVKITVDTLLSLSVLIYYMFIIKANFSLLFKPKMIENYTDTLVLKLLSIIEQNTYFKQSVSLNSNDIDEEWIKKMEFWDEVKSLLKSHFYVYIDFIVIFIKLIYFFLIFLFLLFHLIIYLVL